MHFWLQAAGIHLCFEGISALKTLTSLLFLVQDDCRAFVAKIKGLDKRLERNEGGYKATFYKDTVTRETISTLMPLYHKLRVDR